MPREGNADGPIRAPPPEESALGHRGTRRPIHGRTRLGIAASAAARQLRAGFGLLAMRSDCPPPDCPPRRVAGMSNVARTSATADQPFNANDAAASQRPEGCSTMSVTAWVIVTIGKYC